MKICVKLGCENIAMRNSNYCKKHKLIGSIETRKYAAVSKPATKKAAAKKAAVKKPAAKKAAVKKSVVKKGCIKRK